MCLIQSVVPCCLLLPASAASSASKRQRHALTHLLARLRRAHVLLAVRASKQWAPLRPAGATVLCQLHVMVISFIGSDHHRMI
jgi:hypothetical protein